MSVAFESLLTGKFQLQAMYERRIVCVMKGKATVGEWLDKFSTGPSVISAHGYSVC